MVINDEYVAGFLDFSGGFIFKRGIRKPQMKYMLNIQNGDKFNGKRTQIKEIMEYLKMIHNIEYNEYTQPTYMSYRIETSENIKKLIDFMEKHCSIKDKKNYFEVLEWSRNYIPKGVEELPKKP